MTPIAPSGTPIVVGRFKKPAEAVFTGGPEHAISYTWQLASNVTIIYPDSRLYVQVNHLRFTGQLRFPMSRAIACHSWRNGELRRGRTLMAPLRAARGPPLPPKNELIVRLNVVTVSPLYVANALDPILFVFQYSSSINDSTCSLASRSGWDLHEQLRSG